MYIPRFIEPLLTEELTSTPVVIVEGARAVGKTRLLAALREQGALTVIMSMTDPTQLAAAQSNPLAWLRSLPVPFGIDEAQLLPSLPLALKALMDETQESVRCVLTGSAAIGRTGLGGTDPLARRSTRLTLEPLSEAELAQSEGAQPWSVIDQFFTGVPSVHEQSPAIDWEEHIIRGGLPRYRLMKADRPLRGLQRQITADILSVLTDDVLPGERMDIRTAQAVLTHLLMHPSAELNVTAIATAVGIDRRTADRYVDVLERRFLVDEVENFQRPTKKSPRSTAKCYPADTALSASALLGASRNMADPAVRGGLFEAHVVQQVRAHMGWANTPVTLRHWREVRNGRTSEVDLVLQDSQGRLVGIEVKAAGKVSSGHFKGLRQLKQNYGERFHRGFVVYTGEQVVSFDDDLVALPLAALSRTELWTGYSLTSQPSQPSTDGLEKGTRAQSGEPQATLIVSYTQQDQDSLVGGNPHGFARDVVEALEALHGLSAQVLQGVDVPEKGKDGSHIRWDRAFGEGAIFLPFITPRYLKSELHGREFLAADDAARQLGLPKQLLPLVWIQPPHTPSDSAENPVLERVSKLGPMDVSAARTRERNSSDYTAEVERAAARVAMVLMERELHQNT